MKDKKGSHPVDVAEYAIAKGIDREPAFCWWVPYTIRKRDAIIAAVRLRARKATHKYGIEIPYMMSSQQKDWMRRTVIGSGKTRSIRRCTTML